MAGLKTKRYHIIFPALITFGIIFLIYFLLNMVPFGDNTIVIDDAYIQYLDFFGFYKDVLNGDNSIFYSYSNYLGGSTIGMFAYYLASPVNFLVLFFDKNNLVVFYHLAVAIKLSLCAMSMAIFLRVRFSDKIAPLFLFLLSISFALMNYNLVQSKNIMWLDGVYILPFIMLGIYKIISGKSIAWLSVPIALSLVFNWYTGGINLIFSVIWFVIEMFFCNERNVNYARYFFLNIFKYLYSIVTGAFLSMMLMLPVVYNLRQGRGSEFDWAFLSPVFNGNILSAIPKYSVGAQSDASAISLYCGAFVLIGIFLLFTARFIRLKHKIIAAAAIFFALIILYWQPLVFIFSLLKKVGSYHSRYSYVSIVVLIFIAALFFAKVSEIKNKRKEIFSTIAFFIIFLIFEVAFIGLSYKLDNVKRNYMVASVVLAVIIAFLIFFIVRSKNKSVLNVFLRILLVCVVLFDLGINTFAVYKTSSSLSSEYITSYNESLQRYMDEIKKDAGNTFDYRINQTNVKISQYEIPNFNNRKTPWFQANYDESFLMGYCGISGYTSCPDNNILDFLLRMGYTTAGNCITVVNDTLLSADSLLGAKYITSRMPVRGIEQLAYDEKTGYLYKNQYAFPLAFKTEKNISDFSYKNIGFNNSFDYQNRMFKKITGVEKELFDTVDYSEKRYKESVVYSLNNTSDDDIVYGYIPAGSNNNGVLEVGANNEIKYFGWLAPSAFRVTAENNSQKEKIITARAGDTESIGKAIFYKLNKDVLKEMSDVAGKASAKNITFTPLGFSCDVAGKNGEYIFMSVPYTKGINVKINNNTVQPDLFDNTLMCVPLQEGENHIVINYNMPYQKEGILLSIVGVALIICFQLIKKIYYRKQNDFRMEKKNKIKKTHRT